MRVVIFILVFLLSCSSQAGQETLLLSDNSIGNMKISKGMDISLYKIRAAFPNYRVSHEIAQGDSPDYHLFTVSSHEGEALLFFHSYIHEKKDYESGIVKLDELVSCSELVVSSAKVGPKMTISSIPQLESLEFGAGHMNNYLGMDKLWYLFSVGDLHGTAVSKELAIELNPQIECISWPAPWWN